MLADQQRYASGRRRHKELEAIVSALDARCEAPRTTSHAAREMLRRMRRPTTASCCATRSTTPRPTSRALDEELKVLLLPQDPNDDKNVIVEIRGAEGGEEANLFARDLFEMYRGYADADGLEVRGARTRSAVRPGRVQRASPSCSRATACGPA